MIRHRSQIRIIALIVTALSTAFFGIAQTDLESLLARLDGPLGNVLFRLEERPADARTIPALRSAFERKTAKEDRQQIAATLMRLGDRSGRYFEFLAGYVKTAVEDRTPLWEKFDQQGRWLRGQFSAEFENWCAQNHQNPQEIAAVQFMVYPKDVKLLAEVDDLRSLSLFRRGLESPNPGVIAYAVEGLARLNDVSAIPMISASAERIPPGERTVIAAQLPWYSRPEADLLFERLIPDRAGQDHLRNTVRTLRALELKRVLSRSGRAIPE